MQHGPVLQAKIRIKSYIKKKLSCTSVLTVAASHIDVLDMRVVAMYFRIVNSILIII
jgi:hypothetical protein